MASDWFLSSCRGLWSLCYVEGKRPFRGTNEVANNIVGLVGVRGAYVAQGGSFLETRL